jgi:DnaJ-class molecular chaperone
MPYRTTHENPIKPCNRPLTWGGAILKDLTKRLFNDCDDTARRYGWQITPTRHGFGRRYRDPRFDAIAACTGCGGTGAGSSGVTCRSCQGSGRVVSKPNTPPSANPLSGGTA